jgi:hypothetical protein
MNRNLTSFQAIAAADPSRAARLLREVKTKALQPHVGQREVLASQARFKILRAGRRWGKTKLGAREIIRYAVENDNATVWWIANRWRNTRRGYKEVIRQLPKGLLRKPAPAETSTELTLHLLNGTAIEFYSGESPDSLAGAGVTFVILDEAALMKAQVWQQLVRPTLMDTGGSAMIISTPRGRNYFWEMWNRGQDPDVKDMESWWFPQSSNPYIPAEETEAARQELPDLIFRSEIMAEFVSDAASIFNIGEGVIVPNIVPPEGIVYMGVDLARKADYTVISASRGSDRLPVYHDRFTGLRWDDQKDAIVQAERQLREEGAEHVVIGVDETGVGDAMVEQLENEDLDVVPIAFSNKWKLKAVKNLGAALEQGEAFILPEQREEFESYEYEISEAGNYTFQAAVGHDDEVSAKLMEHWLVDHEGPPGVKVVSFAGVEEELAEEEDALDGDWEPLDLSPDSPEEIMGRPDAWE